MQTILGANGQIAEELARELKRNYTSDIRLVSRNPQKVNQTDSIQPANLLDRDETESAVKGSEIAYLTVGLPLDAKTWEESFPPIMENVIAACKKHSVRLVYFDNTYMYPQDSRVLTEDTGFSPYGRKGRVRAAIAARLLQEMQAGNIEAAICRAPEFYGPGKTQSITNALIIEKLRQHKDPMVLLKDDKVRTLIWTPDASKATALIGNTRDAYGQTWHLPCDDNRLTYKKMIDLASNILGASIHYKILRKFPLKVAGYFQKFISEIQELLPRYEHDNLFDSTKFKRRFPNFPTTPYPQGLQELLENVR